MSDLPRLKTAARSALARELIESAAADQSEEGAKERALASLGLGVAGAGLLSAGNAGTASMGAAKTSAGAAKAGLGAIAKTLAAASGAKTVVALLGVGAVVVAAVLAAPERVTDTRSTALGVVKAPMIAPSAALPLEPGQETSTDPPVASSPRALPPAASALPSNARLQASRPATARAGSSPVLSSATAEVAAATPSSIEPLAVLVRVREALRARESARALGMLAELERDAGAANALGEEIAVLRIDALREAGRRVEADTLARDFLARHPTSAYAKRIEKLSNAP